MAIIAKVNYDNKNYILQDIVNKGRIHLLVFGEYSEQDARIIRSNFITSFLFLLLPYLIVLPLVAIINIAILVGTKVELTLMSGGMITLVTIIIVAMAGLTIHASQAFSDKPDPVTVFQNFVGTFNKEEMVLQTLLAYDNDVDILLDWDKFFDRSALNFKPLIGYLKQLPKAELEQILVDSISQKTKSRKVEELRTITQSNSGDKFLLMDARKSIDVLDEELRQLEIRKQESTAKLINYLNNGKLLKALTK